MDGSKPPQTHAPKMTLQYAQPKYAPGYTQPLQLPGPYQPPTLVGPNPFQPKDSLMPQQPYPRKSGVFQAVSKV